jgi:aspartate dehydrogenase
MEAFMAQDLTVGIAGLGAIGLHLARALDKGVPGLQLAAASARDHAKAAANVAVFRNPPRIVPNAELAACDIVVEAAPAAVFEEIATAAIEAGRIFVPSSVGALLPRMHLVERARAKGRASSCPPAPCLAWMPCAPRPRAMWKV